MDELISYSDLYAFAELPDAALRLPQLLQRFSLEKGRSVTWLPLAEVHQHTPSTVELSANEGLSPESQRFYVEFIGLDENTASHLEARYQALCRQIPPKLAQMVNVVWVVLKGSTSELRKWHDVVVPTSPFRTFKVLASDTLREWICDTPGTACWLLETIGKAPRGLSTLERWWQNWTQHLPKTFTPQWLTRAYGPLRDQLADFLTHFYTTSVRADSWAEAKALTIASLLTLEGRDAYLKACTLVLSERDVSFGSTWLETFRKPLVLLLDSYELVEARPWRKATTGKPLVLLLDSYEPHYHFKVPEHIPVIRLYGQQVEAPGNCLIAPPPSVDAFHQALAELGTPSEAIEATAFACAYSWLALYHRLNAEAQGTLPFNLKPEYREHMLPFVLTGRWHVPRGTQQYDDELHLQKATGTPDLFAMRERFAQANASTFNLWLERDQYTLLNGQRAALALMAPWVSQDTLVRFFEQLNAVFSEVDLLGYVHARYRGLSQVSYQGIHTSKGMRYGLASTLDFISDYAALFTQLGENTVKQLAHEYLAPLFADLDQVHWYNLRELLPTLAKLVPRLFLEALQADLAGPRHALTMLDYYWLNHPDGRVTALMRALAHTSLSHPEHTHTLLQQLATLQLSSDFYPNPAVLVLQADSEPTEADEDSSPEGEHD